MIYNSVLIYNSVFKMTEISLTSWYVPIIPAL